MKNRNKNYLKSAKELAMLAGKAILEIYKEKEFKIQTKKNKSPLTEADKVSNKIIISQLKKHFPDHGLLTEEEKDDLNRLEKDYVWIVDPLDGTKEFINRNGEFTVNIALVYMNEPIIGVIYVPITDELYFASKKEGTYYVKQGTQKKIKVSDRNSIKKMIIIKSRSHTSGKVMNLIDKQKFFRVKTAGSSIKGCLVAKGEVDVYFRLGPTNEWDVCAMDLIIKEAGGLMTDLYGNKIQYNKKNTLINGFLVSNNQIHEKLLELEK